MVVLSQGRMSNSEVTPNAIFAVEMCSLDRKHEKTLDLNCQNPFSSEKMINETAQMTEAEGPQLPSSKVHHKSPTLKYGHCFLDQTEPTEEEHYSLLLTNYSGLNSCGSAFKMLVKS